MVGNSGDSVWVRSTTRMAPEAIALAKARRSVVAMMDFLSVRTEFAFDCFWICIEPLPDILRDIADEDVLKPLFQCGDDRLCQRRGREFRRWNGLEPFGFERSEKRIEHLDAARPKFGPHALRSRQAGRFYRRIGAVGRPVHQCMN